MGNGKRTSWAKTRSKGELLRYALLPEDAPAAPAGDVREEARATLVGELLGREGGRRIGEVRRSSSLEERRLELWATKDADAFVTFDGVFFEATTLLGDGRAIVTTELALKAGEDAEKALLRHGVAVASACRRAKGAKPVLHDSGETWLAISQGLAPERARRESIALLVMLVGAILGVPIAFYLGRNLGHSVLTMIDLVFDGLAGGGMAAALALYPLRLLWGPERMAPLTAPDRDEGPYRAAATRPHVRIADPVLDEVPRHEEEDEAEEDEAPEGKRRLGPPS
jgi:hypothetical protein